MTTERCPLCGVSLRGSLIPEAYLREGYYGDWDGVTPQYYGRKIGIEIRGAYDGVLFWQCPDCNGQWHRWAEGDPLRAVAARYIDRDRVAAHNENGRV